MMDTLRDKLYLVAHSVLKRWSRAGIETFLRDSLLTHNSNNMRILCVGGHGPVLDYLKQIHSLNQIVTLDINPEHRPDYLLDLSTSNMESLLPDKFDAIILMEVLEHIPDFQGAISNTFNLLKPTGVLIASVPWSTPLHDKPHDFYRFTAFRIQQLQISSGFSTYELECRGNLLDSIIYLGLRGLKSWGWRGKIIFLLFAPISLLLKKPKRYVQLQDSCIGYNFIATKLI